MSRSCEERRLRRYKVSLTCEAVELCRVCVPWQVCIGVTKPLKKRFLPCTERRVVVCRDRQAAKDHTSCSHFFDL